MIDKIINFLIDIIIFILCSIAIFIFGLLTSLSSIFIAFYAIFIDHKEPLLPIYCYRFNCPNYLDKEDKDKK